PASGRWSATASLNTGRYGHTATLLQNGNVLVVGGGNRNSVLASAELYGPGGPPPAPRIIGASVAGKKLMVVGETFGSGAVILINGEEQATRNDGQNPQTTLIAKKAGKKIQSGDKLQVRNPDGVLSEEFPFTGA